MAVYAIVRHTEQNNSSVRPRRTGLAAVLAIVGLVVQVLLPILHGPHERFADTDHAGGLSLAQASAAHAGEHQGEAGASCQICVAASSAGKHLIGSDVPTARLILASAFLGCDQARESACSPVRLISCGPRGPPSLA